MGLVIDWIYRAIRFVIDDVIGNVAALVMLGGTLLAIAEIIRRYLLGLTFPWGQDAVTYSIVSAVFLFFAVTQARRSHLSMTAVLDLLKAKGLDKIVMVARAFISLIGLSFFSAVAWWGIPAIERSAAMGRVTQSMVLPIWPFQLCLAIGFALMALVTLFHLYQDIQALRGKSVFPWASSEEGLDI